MVRSWTNTSPTTQGIVNVRITCVAGKCLIRVQGNRDGALHDWGEVVVESIYADSPASRRGMAFIAKYDLEFAETLIEGNVNAGLLVLAAFHTFRDGSRRANYFSREFFHEVTP